MNKVVITKEEQKAIKALQRLAKKWPNDLTLFSWSGSLCLLKNNDEGRCCLLPDRINGIPNDGGDPGNKVYQFAEFEYE